MDLVVNHTSNEHPWFKSARSDPKSKYRDWYVWSKKRPHNYKEGMVFPGVQKATWTYDKEARLWYHHRFYDFQPDLNIDNLEVRTEIQRIMGYWLELGVSGFRVDAVPSIIESLKTGRKRVRHYGYLADMRNFLQWRSGDAILLGEANVLPNENPQFFGEDGERLQMMFNFYVNQHLFYTLATADVAPLVRALNLTRRIPLPFAQWVFFLRNHDEVYRPQSVAAVYDRRRLYVQSPSAAKTVLPVISKSVWSYKRINVESQRYDPNSLLNRTVRRLRLRKECPELGWGNWRILNTRNPSVLAILYEWRNNYLLTLHNFSDQPQDVTININVEGGERLVNLVASDPSEAVRETRHRIALESYSYRWYRVGGLRYILKREKY